MSVPSIVSTGQRLIATTYLDSCVIGDRAQVRDDKGGKTVAWTDRSEIEPCRFVALKDEMPRIEAGQQFGAPTATWLAPLGVEIDEGDRITNLQDGGRWIVTSNWTVPSALAITARYGIRKAEGGESD